MSELFAGAAWHYARYRPGYPVWLFEEIVRRFRDDGTGRVLDLGCGTGQLTVPLAGYFREVVGVDPQPEMLVEAASRAGALEVANVRWFEGGAAGLPSGVGRFDLVTMGRSFHWMDREQVLGVLHDVVGDGGGLVIANDSCLVRPVTAWQRAVEEIQERYMPGGRRPAVPLADAARTHEEVLRDSPFPNVDRVVHEFERAWTVEKVIGYLYSTSLPVLRLLGGRRPQFEEEVGFALDAYAVDGRLIEPVGLEVHFATR